MARVCISEVKTTIRLFFCVACLGGSPVLLAEDRNANARELAEVQAKIKRVGSDVKELAAEKAVQIEQLRKLEKQYGEQINALESVKGEIAQQEHALQLIRDKIVTAQKDIALQQTGLEGLIRSAHAMGSKEGIDVLLNQRDPALSGRMLIYYNYIRQARIEKLQMIEADFKTLQQLEAQKDTETQLLQVAMQKKQQETDELRILKQQRETLLTQINRDYAGKKSELVTLRHDEKKLEALVASLQKTDDNAGQRSLPKPVVENKAVVAESRPDPVVVHMKKKERLSDELGKSFAELKGHLPWPVQGAILERFGSRRFETTWDGTVIGAKEGATIRAVAAGRVVYADWLRGYGLMMIIDHGKGYMSLYAFNQSLSKSVGEFVSAGDTLASVGRSGGRSKASLYFGIRQKGRAVDPEKWCRKPGKG